MESVRTTGFRGITNYDDAHVTGQVGTRFVTLKYSIPTLENPAANGPAGFGQLNCEVTNGRVVDAAIPNNYGGTPFNEYYAEYYRRGGR
jgi:hypothetical protein